jgi:HEAT repeat protein
MAELIDPDPRVRIEATFELAQNGSMAGRETLLTELSDPDWQVRQRAASRLGRIGPAWAINGLAKLLDDPISGVRNVAIFALLNVGRPAVVPLLLRALRDDDPDIQEDAATALSSLLGKDVAYEFEETIGEEDASRMEDWWADEAKRFRDDLVYERGQPASIGTLIDQFRNASPQVVESIADDLFDRTGQRFKGSKGEQVAAWDQWWQTNKAAFQDGKRYFHGKDVDKLV